MISFLGDASEASEADLASQSVLNIVNRGASSCSISIRGGRERVSAV